MIELEDRRYAVCVKTETEIHVMAYGCHWCIVQALHRQNNGVVEDERESAATNGSTELRTAVSARHGLIGVKCTLTYSAGNVKSSLQHSTGAAQSRCHCLARQFGRSDLRSGNLPRARTRSHRHRSLSSVCSTRQEGPGPTPDVMTNTR